MVQSNSFHAICSFEHQLVFVRVITIISKLFVNKEWIIARRVHLQVLQQNVVMYTKHAVIIDLKNTYSLNQMYTEIDNLPTTGRKIPRRIMIF